MATTCLQATQLAATIFAAIFGTLLLCLVFLALLFYWARSRQWVKFDLPLLEKSLSTNAKKGSLTRVHPLKVVGVEDEMDGCLPTNKQLIVQMQPNERQKKPANMEDDLVDVVGFSVSKQETSGFVVENVDVEAASKFSKGDRLVSIQIDVQKMTLEEVETILHFLTAFHYTLSMERGAQNKDTSSSQSNHFISVQPNSTAPSSQSSNPTTTSHCSFSDSSTPKVDESHELSTLSAVSQPPSLPSGSPPLSVQEEVVEACSPTQTASPSTSCSPVVVRLRQQPVLEPPAQPSSTTCSTHMGFLKVKEEDVVLTSKAVELEDGVVHQQQQPPIVGTKTVELELVDSKNLKNGFAKDFEATKEHNAQTISAESDDLKNYQNIVIPVNKEIKQLNEKMISGHNSILSLEQCGTLEANRKRLERERQQLRQLGII